MEGNPDPLGERHTNVPEDDKLIRLSFGRTGSGYTPPLSTPDTLNPDVLSHIFNYAVHQSSSYPDIRCLLAIGSVCSLWRNTAWELPHLWNFISIAGLPIFKPIDNNKTSNWVEVVRLCLRNSSRLPLTIALNAKLLADIPQIDRKEIIRTLIEEASSERVDSLEIYISSKYFVWLENYHGLGGLQPNTFPNLRKFSLHHSCRCDSGGIDTTDNPTSFLLGTYQTANLDSDDSLPIIRRPPFGNDDNAAKPPERPVLGLSSLHITSLTLVCVPLDQCIRLLLECTNLVEWRCRFPLGPSVIWVPSHKCNENRCEEKSITPGVWVLEKLEIMEWTRGTPNHNPSHFSWESLVRRHVRLPNLRRLIMDGFHPGIRSTLLHFCSHMKVLEALELRIPTGRSFEDHKDQFNAFCQQQDQLKELVISTQHKGSLVDIVNCLTLRPELDSHANPLPYLKSLTILTWNGLNPFKLAPFRNILKFLWSRRGHMARAAMTTVDGKKSYRELEEIVLEYAGYPHWDRKEEKLRIFVEDGLLVKMISHAKDWHQADWRAVQNGYTADGNS